MYFKLSIISQKKKDHSVVSFQEDWLTKDEFKSWLWKVEKKPQKAYSIIYSKTIDIASGRSLALQSHQKGKMHSELVMKRNENRIGDLFQKKSADSAATAANEVQVVSTFTKPPFVVSEDVLDVEIIWCLRLVHSHQSYRSCNPVLTVFQRMFKTSPVAQ